MRRRNRQQTDRSTEQPEETTMKTAKPKNMRSRRTANAIDTIKAVALVTVTLVILALVLAFYYVFWQTLTSRPKFFVQAWAVISTTLVLIGTIGGVAVGLYFGLKQSGYVLDGVKLAVGQVIHAAEQVSEVRVTTMGRYGRMNERKGTQEWILDNENIFGVKDKPQPQQLLLPQTDMPSDETGRAGE